MRGRLIVNLGNTRIAWRGAGEEGVVRHEGRPEQALAAAFAKRPPPDEVVIGSVAARELTANLRLWCSNNWGVEVRELAAVAEACDVRNAYAEPARLGIDRWAALVAARHAYEGGVLIADCGTAVTVDYLARDGRHLGGLIAPGLGMMRETLVRGTQLRLSPEPAPLFPLLAADTETAVAAGTLGAIVAWLARVAEEIKAGYGEPQARLITGGDAALVLERLGTPWRAAPDLVLDGLERLAGADA